jgi:hypothetical protein
MDERREEDFCVVCGRPIFRWVTIRTFKAPRPPELKTTFWLHEHDKSFACGYDRGEFAGGTF